MKASVAQLAQLPGVWRGGELEHALQPVVATGHEALDRELPGGGWPTGTLSEVLHDCAGIALPRCLVVRPAHRDDSLWAAEQALRSGACGALLFWLPCDEYAWLRRLQMAAEAGRAMAVLFRSTAAEKLSTPAHLRVALTREEGELHVRIPKRRGPPLTTPIRLAISRQARDNKPQEIHSASHTVFAQRPRAIA